jgi:hypothetical protein
MFGGPCHIADVGMRCLDLRDLAHAGRRLDARYRSERLRERRSEPAGPRPDIQARQRAPTRQHASEATDPDPQLPLRKRSPAGVVLILLDVVVDPLHHHSRVAPIQKLAARVTSENVL